MATTLTMPDGETVEEPTPADLTRALDALLTGADAEADLWLEDDDGWTLSVVTTGDIFFENADEDEERYWTLGPLDRDGLLPLLELLARGDIPALRAQGWEEGE